MDNFDYAYCKIHPETEIGTLKMVNNSLKVFSWIKNEHTSTLLFNYFIFLYSINKQCIYKLGMIPSETIVRRTNLNRLFLFPLLLYMRIWIYMFDLLNKNRFYLALNFMFL